MSLDRSSSCFALSSPTVGRLRCRLNHPHRGGHEADLNGNTYVWWDEKDTTKHPDSPCAECGEPFSKHRAPEDSCPDKKGGRFHVRG